MDKQEAKYTVFAKWNDGSNRQGLPCFFPPLSDAPLSLSAMVEYVRNYHGPDSFIPVGWTTDAVGFGDFPDAMESALAAGRVIDPINGAYVPRFVPSPSVSAALEKLETAFYGQIITSDEWRLNAGDLRNLPAGLTAGVRNDGSVVITQSPEPKRPPLDWNKPTPFDPWKGFRVVVGDGVRLQDLDVDEPAPFAGLQLDGCEAFKAPVAVRD